MKCSNRLCRVFIAAALACMVLRPVCAQTASEEDEDEESSTGRNFFVVAGVKGWSSTWQSWLRIRTAYGEASRDVIQTLSSPSKIATIPQLSVRYGNWFVSASTLTDTTYKLAGNWLNAIPGIRNEVDGNLGYYVLPGLAFSVGYKKITQSFESSDKWSGPTAALTGTAGLDRGFSVYGTVAFGQMNATAPKDGTDNTSFNANYYLTEAGLAYSFGGMGRLVRSVNMTLGYRTQTVVTKGYQLADFSTPSPTLSSVNVRDTTQGLALGLSAVF